jgi:putative SOS response-associated peptidase YedK
MRQTMKGVATAVCKACLVAAGIVEHNPPTSNKSIWGHSIMCGRFTLTRPAQEVAEQFDLDQMPLFEPRYNIAPTQNVLAVRKPDAAIGREAVLLRWGLVPSWASDLSIGVRLLNARAETVVEKPAFRTAFVRRRCLLPADGFYEWQTVAGKKQPIHFRFDDGRLFALAGLWEHWHGPDGVVESCTVVTTHANELVRPVHDRMPVILDPEVYDEWLDPGMTDKARLSALLVAHDASKMVAVPANPRVNNARNEGPACLAL